MWGAAAGATLFGVATLAAFAGWRLGGITAAERNFRFLTSPLSGGLSALALVGTGALVGGLACRSAGVDEGERFENYVLSQTADLSKDEVFSMLGIVSRVWGKEQARVVFRTFLSRSNWVGETSTEEVDSVIVEATFLEFTSQAPLSAQTKLKLLNSLRIRVDETVADQLTDEQTVLIFYSIDWREASTLVSNPDAVRDGVISIDSGLAREDGWNHAADWNKAIVLLHGAIHGVK